MFTLIVSKFIKKIYLIFWFKKCLVCTCALTGSSCINYVDSYIDSFYLHKKYTLEINLISNTNPEGN